MGNASGKKDAAYRRATELAHKISRQDEEEFAARRTTPEGFAEYLGFEYYRNDLTRQGEQAASRQAFARCRKLLEAVETFGKAHHRKPRSKSFLTIRRYRHFSRVKRTEDA